MQYTEQEQKLLDGFEKLSASEEERRDFGVGSNPKSKPSIVEDAKIFITERNIPLVEGDKCALSLDDGTEYIGIYSIRENYSGFKVTCVGPYGFSDRSKVRFISRKVELTFSQIAGLLNL